MEREKLQTTWRLFRVAAGVALGGLLLGFSLLLLFDIFRPNRGPTLGMLVIRVWPLTPLLALASLMVAAAIMGWARIKGLRILATRCQRLVLYAAALFVLPEALVFIEGAVYEPLKFAYLIHRVEAAHTPAAERAAFASANRWGYVWELNRLTSADRKWWPDHMQHLPAEWLLELEWLESSGRSGEPYRAYRVVLDEKNLEVFR